MGKVGFVAGASLLLLVLGSCQQAVLGNLESTTITLEAQQGVTNGVFLGGGVLVNPTNPSLNYLANVDRVGLRLARVEAVEGVDESGVASVRYNEVKGSVWTGWLSVSAVTSGGLVFDLDLYDETLRLRRSERQLSLAPGGSLDLNDDGLADLEYKPFDDGGRSGFDGTFLLNFVSHKPNLGALGSSAKHRAQDDPSFPYPMGIQTVNPSGKLVVVLVAGDNVTEGSSSLTTAAAAVPRVIAGDFVNFVTPQELVTGLDRLYTISAATESGGQVTLSTQTATLGEVYEMFTLGLVGNVSELEQRFLRADSRNLLGRHTLLTGPVTTRPIITTDLGLPSGLDGHLRVNSALNVALNVRHLVSVSWTEVSGQVDAWLSGDASFFADLSVNRAWQGDRRALHHNINTSFLIGPVPVSVGGPVSVGVTMNLQSAARFWVGGSVNATLGGASGRAAAWIDGIIPRTSWSVVQIPPSFTTTWQPPAMSFTGSAVVEPYVLFVPSVTVAGVLTSSVNLRAWLRGTASFVSQSPTEITVDWNLDASLRAWDPSVRLGFRGLSYDHTWSRTLFERTINLVNGRRTFARR